MAVMKSENSDDCRDLEPSVGLRTTIFMKMLKRSFISMASITTDISGHTGCSPAQISLDHVWLM